MRSKVGGLILIIASLYYVIAEAISAVFFQCFYF